MLWSRKKTELEKLCDELKTTDTSAEGDVGLWRMYVEWLADDKKLDADAKASLADIMQRRGWGADALARDVRAVKTRRLIQDPAYDSRHDALISAAKQAKDTLDVAKAAVAAAETRWREAQCALTDHRWTRDRWKRIGFATPRIFGTTSEAVDDKHVARMSRDYGEN
jgi:hypothetical protein